MKFKPSFPDIPEANPFANCKLNREPFAKMLTSVINNSDGGFTLALNGPWGTGKTAFIKMWQKQLELNGYRTVYINTSETDFTSSPLTPILGEICSIVGKDKKAIKRILKSLPKSILFGVGGFVSTHIGINAIKNLFSRHKSYDEEISLYCDQKEAIGQFHSELSNFIKVNCCNRPLIIFVDDLDRCRPNYAVEFLEKIKHFFSIDNIIFVISVDKKHLAESIKGHYGSANIDTNEYFRRFFDIEYDLPEPEIKPFCEYIFKRENLDGIRTPKETEILLDIILRMVENEKMTLRQVERYISQLKLCYASYKELLCWHDLSAFLVFHKYFKPEIYNKLKSSAFTLDELSKFLSDIYEPELQKEAFKGPYKMSYLVTNLLYRYSKQLGTNCIPYTHGSKIPTFYFNTHKLEQDFAYRFVSKLIELNDDISLSDLYQLIDLSLPYTEKDMELTKQSQLFNQI